MKTRDINVADSEVVTEEKQEVAVNVTQPLSPSSTPRQRAPRASSKVVPTQPQVVDVQKNSGEPLPLMSEEYATDRDIIMHQEKKEMPLLPQQQLREDFNRPMPQSSAQQYSSHERPTYTKRPLEDLSLAELIQYARRYGIMGAAITKKDELIKKVRYAEEHPNFEMAVEGVLEKLPDGFGFLRSALYDYVSGPDDIYVSPSQIRRFALRTGDTITGEIRKPKEGEKYFALLKVSQVNYAEPLSMIDRSHFDSLSPQHPIEKFNLEFDPMALSTRILDLFTPVGKGQRGLIVAPT